jgi:hypothetical protein
VRAEFVFFFFSIHFEREMEEDQLLTCADTNKKRMKTLSNMGLCIFTGCPDQNNIMATGIPYIL